MPRAVKNSISLSTAEKRKRAVDLKRTGATFEQIATDLGCSTPYAWRLYQDALKAIPATSVEQHRAEELDKLLSWERKAVEVLDAFHPYVQNGKIINRGHKDPGTGRWVVDEELTDAGPVLAAIDRLVKIQDARRKLLGLDAPARTDVNLGPVDAGSIELRALLEQRQAANDAERERLAEGAP